MDRKTARRLRSLLERKRRAEMANVKAGDELAAAIYTACEEQGASRREVATELNVGVTTVQDWVNRGRQLRGT